MVEHERSVTELAGARVPADHGLTGLGLLMQLGGGVALGAMVALAMMPVFSDDGGRHMTVPLFLLGASGAIRAIYHRTAGSALLYDAPRGPLHAVKVYLAVALVETAVWLYVLRAHLDLGVSGLVATAVLLLAWPLAVTALLTRPRLRRVVERTVPVAEDLGFESVAVLMSLLGATGVVVCVVMVVSLWRAGAEILLSGPALIFLGVLVVLLIRSTLHVVAGWKGTRGLDSDGATEAASRYYGFGAFSAVVIGAALLILLVTTGLHPAALLLCGVQVYLLLVWPLALRRYFTERNFALLLDGQQAPSFRRAPDAGLTALGWLLIATAVFGLAIAVPRALFGAGLDLGPAALGHAFAGDPGAGLGTVLVGVGVALLQLVAGLALIAMTDRARLAATVYGVSATIAAVVQLWLFGGAQLGPGMVDVSADSFLAAGMLATQLVLPVGTLLLVHRKLTPDARARFR